MSRRRVVTASFATTMARANEHANVDANERRERATHRRVARAWTH